MRKTLLPGRQPSLGRYGSQPPSRQPHSDPAEQGRVSTGGQNPAGGRRRGKHFSSARTTEFSTHTEAMPAPPSVIPISPTTCAERKTNCGPYVNNGSTRTFVPLVNNLCEHGSHTRTPTLSFSSPSISLTPGKDVIGTPSSSCWNRDAEMLSMMAMLAACSASMRSWWVSRGGRERVG